MMRRRLGVVLAVSQLAMFAKFSVSAAQDCLLAAEKRLPPFSEINDSPRLPNKTQAIITSYKFGCCGNISAWQTYVGPGSGILQGVYDITFQVWRPSPTVQGNGCYSIVGENRFTTTVYYDRVSETPEPTNILTVQPGDVVGYYALSRFNSNREGIQLDTNRTNDRVWFYSNTEPLFIGGPNCSFPVGSGNGSSLISSTNAAPVLSVRVSRFSCPPNITISSSSLPPPIIATASSIPTQPSIIIPQPLNTLIPLPSHIRSSVSMLSSSVPSLAPTTSSALSTAVIASIAAVGSSAILLTFLCTLVLAIAICKVQHKRRRTLTETSSVVTDQQVKTLSMTMQGNEAYMSISHTTDGCYASTINMEPHLYEPVNNGSEIQEDVYECIPDEPHYY